MTARVAQTDMAADTDRFRKLAAGSAILAVPLAYVTVALIMLATGFDPSVFEDPGALVAIGVEGAALFRLSQVVDMFGFYLLWIPPMVYLWHWLRPHAPLTVGLVSGLGVTFAAIAALGAAVNATTLPPLMVDYAAAGPAERAAIATLFSGFSNAVIVGLFGIFARLLISVWLLGIGYYLRRERRYLGAGAIGFGLFTTLSFLGNVLGYPAVHSIGVSGYIFLGPLWLLWLGIVLWRQPTNGDTIESMTATPAGAAE